MKNYLLTYLLTYLFTYLLIYLLTSRLCYGIKGRSERRELILDKNLLSLHIVLALLRLKTSDSFRVLRRRTRVRELLEAKRLDEPAVERRDHSSIPKVGYTELFRKSVFVWFAFRTRTKADEIKQIACPKAT